MASLLAWLTASEDSGVRRLAAGFRDTLPIALAVAPFGVAFGAVARGSMANWQAGLMSVIVFTGTAQFITASLLSQGAAYLPILLTGLIVNLRMVLLSAALSPYVRQVSRPWQLLIGQMLTDESFAVSLAEFERGRVDRYYPVGSGLAIFVFWQASTWTGLLVGARIPAGLGLEFALPASLICLLFLLVRDRTGVVTALLAAALGLLLRPLVTGTWSTLVATLIAATLGVGGMRWRRRS